MMGNVNNRLADLNGCWQWMNGRAQAMQIEAHSILDARASLCTIVVVRSVAVQSSALQTKYRTTSHCQGLQAQGYRNAPIHNPECDGWPQQHASAVRLLNVARTSALPAASHSQACPLHSTVYRSQGPSAHSRNITTLSNSPTMHARALAILLNLSAPRLVTFLAGCCN